MPGIKTWNNLPQRWQEEALTAFLLKDNAKDKEVIIKWFNAGFTKLDDAAKWFKEKRAIKDPVIAFGWYDAKFPDPQDAYNWKSARIGSPKDTYAWFENENWKNIRGKSRVGDWYRAGFTDPKVAWDWHGGKFSRASDAKIWFDNGKWKKNPEEAWKWYQAGVLKPEDISEWEKVGLTDRNVIMAWREAGFSKPEDISEWEKVGFTDRNVIMAWRKEIYDPKVAWDWFSEGFDLAQAESWNDAGWYDLGGVTKDGQKDVKKWSGIIREWSRNTTWKMVPRIAKQWYKAGFTDPEKAFDWLNENFEVYNASVWRKVGFEDAKNAKRWEEAKFRDAKKAAKWHDNPEWKNNPEEAYNWYKAKYKPETATAKKDEYKKQGIINIHMNSDGKIVDKRGREVTLADRTGEGKGGEGNTSKKAVIKISTSKLTGKEVEALLENNTAQKIVFKIKEGIEKLFVYKNTFESLGEDRKLSIHLPENCKIVGSGHLENFKNVNVKQKKSGKGADTPAEDSFSLPEGITLENNNTVLKVGTAFEGGVFGNDIKIPRAVKKIDLSACKSILSIDVSVCSDLPSLEEITLPPKLRVIRQYAFSKCKKLRRVKFNADGTLNIQRNAFKGSKVGKIVMDGSVKEINIQNGLEFAGIEKVRIKKNDIKLTINNKEVSKEEFFKSWVKADDAQIEFVTS